jgi:polysaccharide export outer membrane protein
MGDRTMMSNLKVLTQAIAVLLLVTAGAAAQVRQTPAAAPQAKPPVSPAAPQAVAGQIVPPADYVIGTGDVLVVMFRREKDMSAEVTVRPDGKITLPLLNDVQATGLTPDQLREKVTEGASRLVEEPSVTVMVKEINSRKVFITGQVAKPGAYDFGTRMTVLQLIAMAGGLGEFAKGKEILVIRETPGAAGRPGAQPVTFKFNYHEVQKGKNLASNLELKPGDTVIVP